MSWKAVLRKHPSGARDVVGWQPDPGWEIPGIGAYRGFQLELARPERYLMVANMVTVVICFEGEVRFGTGSTAAGTAGAPSLLIVGPHSRAMVAEHDRRLRGMSVALEPWVGYALFGPMHRLANSIARPSDVLGVEITSLVRALEATPTWAQRFERLQELLVRRYANGWRSSPAVVHAWQELSSANGAISIEKLAGTVGWCRRNLERRFREQIGLSPKAVARLLRLGRACRLLARGLATSEVAAACGYYDQAHFVNDFKRLTGRTPGDISVDGALHVRSSAVRAGQEDGDDYPAILPGLVT